jgi:hypothetical protein
LRKSSTVWIWQQGKRTDVYKILLNYKDGPIEKKAGKGPNLKKSLIATFKYYRLVGN